MIYYMLFYIVTHKTILSNLLLLLNWIRHRRIATIAINKTTTPTVIIMIIPVELDPSDMLLSLIIVVGIIKSRKRNSKCLEFNIIPILLLNFTIPTD